MAWGSEPQNQRFLPAQTGRGMCVLFIGGALAGHLPAHSRKLRNAHRRQGESQAGEGGVRMYLQAFCKTLCLITQEKAL